ncbi:hypothetical protein RRU94_05185 [Domibacillus sp. DTU_2020_1001157_1_SI_ALB_TIR_016]|uniref:hypothetical protein n=1 Tax=Domibacillus sp. DTU_2020_1001157_1_SI_ALB_TIR_016 TaxID=3077789 RepID=UPI0028EE0BE3|nr:hypothetical protein [Domibacillus sp. DTU_2020_1001157_1_SI_ALB_TIR_016]WNS77877.1 hypothetical protein RRU94_05185 [Domibacillus sp. DTU_2020_1001157_1_SI_ALB_TIR_016]
MKKRIVSFLSVAYVLFMAVLAFVHYMEGDDKKALVAAGGVVCGLIPLILALFTRLQFNLPLIVFYFIFLLGSQYFGSILGWYGLGWWDFFMHAVSGVLLAFTGIALYERFVHREAGNEISSWFVALFVLSFAVLGGVIWEFYEFSMDQFFGMTLQGGGNKDTMEDLIADTLGGVVIALQAGVRKRFDKSNKTRKQQ